MTGARVPEPRVRFVLASASPARLSTLRSAGLSPEVVVSGVEESAPPSAEPVDVALGLARRKAFAVAARVQAPALVLGCDSVLELDGETLGKPADAGEAVRRWRRMRGRRGTLHTGHCLVDVGSGRDVDGVESTVVHFAELSDREIEDYVRSGEPMQVAGAFTIDGLGGAFVRRIEGDPHNVVGVSLPMLRELAARLGIAWTDLWT
jgi:septum formation protein